MRFRVAVGVIYVLSDARRVLVPEKYECGALIVEEDGGLQLLDDEGTISNEWAADEWETFTVVARLEES